jgi:hypothetical protein
VASLESRIKALNKSKITDDWYWLIRDYLLVPMIPQLCEERGVLHKAIGYRGGEKGYVYKLDLEFERDRRRGFWNWLARAACPYVTGISITYENSLFACTYYDYRYFQYAEDIKKAYYEKLREGLGVDMVVVGQAW